MHPHFGQQGYGGHRRYGHHLGYGHGYPYGRGYHHGSFNGYHGPYAPDYVDKDMVKNHIIDGMGQTVTVKPKDWNPYTKKIDP